MPNASSQPSGEPADGASAASPVQHATPPVLPANEASSDGKPKADRGAASPKPGRKPFPWPLLLAAAAPLAAAGLLAWLWRQEDLYTLGRTGWICVSVVLPGFSVMTILGGAAQFRRRPIFSSLALLFAVATFLACVWGVRLVTEATWLD